MHRHNWIQNTNHFISFIIGYSGWISWMMWTYKGHLASTQQGIWHDVDLLQDTDYIVWFICRYLKVDFMTVDIQRALDIDLDRYKAGHWLYTRYWLHCLVYYRLYKMDYMDVDIQRALGIDLNRYNTGQQLYTRYWLSRLVDYRLFRMDFMDVDSGGASNGSCKFILCWFLNALSLSLSFCWHVGTEIVWNWIS